MKTANEIVEQIGDINDILDNIQILKKLIKGIDSYTEIQKLYNDGKVTDDNFIKKYSAYYQLRFVSDGYVSAYFGIMQRLRDGEKLSFKEIATELYGIDSKHRFSLITKLMHTADTSLPLYDNLVADVLDIHLAADTDIEAKISESEQIIDSISALYTELGHNDGFKRVVAEFDGKIPGRISFAKKCDFILWALGTSKKQSKK